MATDPRNIRLLAIASAGGHWIQLCRLSEAFAPFDTRYVTTAAVSEAPSGSRAVGRVLDASRRSPVKLVLLALQLLRLVLQHRPQVVVTTGAAPGLIALRLGKLLGARTIWIDSVANADEPSLSARLAQRHSDLWLTQWPDVAERTAGMAHWGRVF